MVSHLLTALSLRSLPSCPSPHDLVNVDPDSDCDPDSGIDNHHGEAPGADP